MVKETLEKFERQNGEKNKEVIRRKLELKDEIEKANNSNDGLKEMVEKLNNKKEASSVQIICKKLELDLQKEKRVLFETKQLKTKRHNRDKRRSRESYRHAKTKR